MGMITKIEARNYKAFKYISQEVKPFQILIGPNASGKSTFLDIVAFIEDIMNLGLRRSVRKRTSNYEELTFNRQGGTIDFAIELSIPMKDQKVIDCRYEIRIGEVNNVTKILGERTILFTEAKSKQYHNREFIQEANHKLLEQFDDSNNLGLLGRIQNKNTFIVFQRYSDGNINHRTFYPDSLDITDETGFEYNIVNLDDPIIVKKLGFRPINIGNRETLDLNFLIGNTIYNSVFKINLESTALAIASDPGQESFITSSGSNLPWLIEDLKAKNAELYQLWLGHIQMALPDVEEINILKMENHNMRYISIKYKDGANISSWMLSDGTLRLLALTFIAYQPETKGMYLIEEPENGVHPKNLSYIYQSLSSVYGAQVFIATHSPLLLSIAGKGDLLLFSKNEDGSISISDAEDNDYLKKWDSSAIGLGSIFASGILS